MSGLVDDRVMKCPVSVHGYSTKNAHNQASLTSTSPSWATPSLSTARTSPRTATNLGS